MVHKNCCQINPIICENKDFLKKLSKTKSSIKRHKLLKNATKEQLLAIAEISLNIVKSRFPLTKCQKQKLIPYANIVRQMSRLRSQKGAKKLIIQKGGGAAGLFSSLLTPILIELAKSLYIKDKV
jgi:hypothetical protein